MGPQSTRRKKVKEKSATSYLSSLLVENSSITSQTLEDSKSHLLDISSSNSSKASTTAINTVLHIEISSQRTCSSVTNTTLRLLISDSLLQLKVRTPVVTSTQSLEHSTTWPQRSISSSHTKVDQLISLQLQSSFSSWSQLIHHSPPLSHKIHFTDVSQQAELISSGGLTVSQRRTERTSSPKTSRTSFRQCSNLTQLTDPQFQRFLHIHG